MQSNQEFYITRETYERKAGKIKKAISALMKGTSKGMLLIENTDFEDERILFWEKIIRNSPSLLRIEEREEGRLFLLFLSRPGFCSEEEMIGPDEDKQVDR